MEAQFGRVARMFWQINAEMELTEVWANRLTKMAAALQRYKKTPTPTYLTGTRTDYTPA